ncbi:MAG: ASKHA domain-containing protein [Eubacteriales bacterium]|nr:ASKHA domain-containing protein [Eubacteriales bacterium]
MTADSSKTYTLTVSEGKTEKKITAQGGESILSALRSAGFQEPAAPCDGLGRCGACLVRITGTISPLSGAHTCRTVQDEELPACRWRPAGDCTITLPQRAAARTLMTGAENISPRGEGLGLAVDIGTTTVACFLYDLSSGRFLGAYGGRSAQRAFGADVLSRIRHCSSSDGQEQLTALIREQILDLAQKLCRNTNHRTEDIQRVSIAGNTTMQHIFAGLSPVSLGTAPFTPLSLFGLEQDASDFFPGFAPGAVLYLTPALAGYVGGDVTAGLYASGSAEEDGLCLYLDIGTNGEMGLGNKNGFLCCAAAAGPAFEGAEISCGMDASDGAVDRVYLKNGIPVPHVLGNVPARGLCGSGLIDAAAALLTCGAMTPSGRLLPPEEAPEALQPFLRRDEKGFPRFYLTEEVYVSSQDLRELQLAKAALRAGAETLLSLCGKNPEDIDSLLIAGGFGAYMDLDSALRIGLLPPVPKDKIRHVGNAAGAGAALALDPDKRAELETFSACCSYHELSGSELFSELYLENMSFEEDEE